MEDAKCKFHFCYFCEERTTQIARHLKKFCHEARQSKEVKQLEDSNVGDKTKLKILNKLKQDGDYKHNLRGKSQ